MKQCSRVKLFRWVLILFCFALASGQLCKKCRFVVDSFFRVARFLLDEIIESARVCCVGCRCGLSSIAFISNLHRFSARGRIHHALIAPLPIQLSSSRAFGLVCMDVQRQLIDFLGAAGAEEVHDAGAEDAQIQERREEDAGGERRLLLAMRGLHLDVE